MMYCNIYRLATYGCALQDIYKKWIGYLRDACDCLTIYNVFTHIYTEVDVHAKGYMTYYVHI